MVKSEAQKDAEFRAAISRHAAGMVIRKIVPRQVTVQAGEYLIGELTTPEPCTLNESHCRLCGSTSEEDIGWSARERNDGYSDCCNEVVESGIRNCRNHHDG